MYEYGNGVDQDKSLAYVWYKVSMANGRAFKSKPFLENITKKMSDSDIGLANYKIKYCKFPNYQLCNICERSRLERLKENGKKVGFANLVKSLNYLELPALCGDLDALNFMGVYSLYLGNQKLDAKLHTEAANYWKQAFEYWKQGMALGDVEAMSNVAGSYCSGKSVKQDVKKCLKLRRRAIEKGSKLSAYNLGTHYMLGEHGILQDDVIAYMWYYISEIDTHLEYLEENYLTSAEVITAKQMALKCVSSGYKECAWY